METTNPDDQISQMLNLGPIDGNEKLYSDTESAPSLTKQPGPVPKMPINTPSENPLPDLYYGELDQCGLTWRFICIALLYLYIASDIAMQIFFGYLNGCSIFDDALLFLYASAILIRYCTTKKMDAFGIVMILYIITAFAGFIGKTMGIIWIKRLKTIEKKWILILIHVFLLEIRTYFIVSFVT